MNDEEIEVAYSLIKEYENKKPYRDYAYFLEHVTNFNYKHAKHTRMLCNLMHKVEKGEIKRLIVSMPPRHSKSETISRFFPVWYLGRNPNEEVMLASYSADLATDFSRTARDTMEIYGKDIFDIEVSKTIHSADKWGIKGTRGIMNAVGIGGSATGKGFSLGIIDDPIKNQVEALNENYMNKVYEWYKTVFYTRRAPNAKIILVMTRWSDTDLVARIIDDDKDNEWTVVNLPAVCESTDDVLGRKINETLWPERFDLKFYEDARATLGSRDWQALYQCSPTSASGNIFKRNWFKFYDVLPADIKNYCISLDATFKDSNNSDYVVMQCWGRNKTDYYLIDQIRDRMDFVTTVQTFKNFCRKHHKAKAKYVEDKANGSAIINVLKKEINGLIPINPRDSKEARAAAVTPLFEAGNIYIPSNVLWIGDYIEELVTFPLAKNDDQCDATTQVLNNWKTNSSWSFA